MNTFISGGVQNSVISGLGPLARLFLSMKEGVISRGGFRSWFTTLWRHAWLTMGTIARDWGSYLSSKIKSSPCQPLSLVNEMEREGIHCIFLKNNIRVSIDFVLVGCFYCHCNFRFEPSFYPVELKMSILIIEHMEVNGLSILLAIAKWYWLISLIWAFLFYPKSERRHTTKFKALL